MTDPVATVSLATALEELVVYVRTMPVEPTMSITEASALRAIAVDGPLRISEIADRLGVSQPGATQLVDRLVRAGFAERVADVADGRVVLVRATAGGDARLAQRRESRDRLLSDRTAGLSTADQRAIAAAVPALLRLAAEGRR